MESSGDQSRENWNGRNKRRKKKKKEQGKKQEEGEEIKKKKEKKPRKMEVQKIVEEWEIWNEKKEEVKSEAEARKLVLERFYKWIHEFGKKMSEQMPTRNLWDHAIDMKKGFVPRKGKMYPLSREEREEVYEFISE